MVVIRLSRGGAMHRPFYQVVVIDKRKAREGLCIERIGFYNPIANEKQEAIRIDLEAYNRWLGLGAQPSPAVKKLARHFKAAVSPEQPRVMGKRKSKGVIAAERLEADSGRFAAAQKKAAAEAEKKAAEEAAKAAEPAAGESEKKEG